MNKNSYLYLIKNILLIALGLTLNIFAQTATQPSSGDGSEGNPYQIATLDNLYWLSQDTTKWNSNIYFIQTADIDASSTSSWDDGKGFSPIGNDTVYFNGTYNGNGHTINDLYINRSHWIGLFGKTYSNAVIKNLGMLNVNFEHNASRVGAIIGAAYLSTISNCYSTGTLEGEGYIGGIVGDLEGGTINSCYSTCSVSGNIRLGGLVGYMYGGTIENSFSRGNVTCSNTSEDEIGGFCGTADYTFTIQYCYSTGSVVFDDGSRPNNKGFCGLVNGSDGTYKSNFFDKNTSLQVSDGSGIATTKETRFMQSTLSYTSISASWDFVNNPNNDSQNEDIWSISPLINDGYPFLTWTGSSNYLEPPSNGTGTSTDPYQITDLQDLYWVSQIKTKDKYFIQTSDIDASPTSSWCGGKGFIPIGQYINYGNERFSGHYNGNSHSIDGLFIDRESNSYIGLFGYTYNGIIESIVLNNVNISGGSSVVGALTGILEGASSVINKCSSSGNISGTSTYIGGLVGKVYSSATIKSSYSTCSISGNHVLGGLLGYADNSIISNCYSKGNIVGLSDDLGGFCGYSKDATIEHCYSIGSVEYRYQDNPTDKGFIGYSSGSNTFTANFFDSETSQQSSDASGAATAKTSSEMKNYNTFTAAGWDFVDETDNGINDYWDADQNQTVNDGYVILAWQSGADNTLPVELTTFTANIDNGIVNLNWQTATEINNYGFNVERSSLSASPVKTWDKIGFVEGHGNSNTPNHYSFSDNSITTGKYLYRLKQIDIDGSFEYSKSIEVEIGTPTKFELAQNFPNPFNPTTTIKYSLPMVENNELPLQNVTLKIYDVLGNEVATLVNQKQEVGHYEVQFNASNLSSGIYYYRLQTGNFVQTKKLILMK